MTPARRHLLLFLLLAASAGAVAWDRLHVPAAQADSPVVSAAERPVRSSPRPDVDRGGKDATAPGIAALRSRDDYLADGSDAFPALNPPPPPTPAAPPVRLEVPRPTAPALPFTVIGKKLEAGVWEVFLSKGEQTYVARHGEVLAEDYRVDAIMAEQMTLTFLPLNEPQILQTGTTLQ